MQRKNANRHMSDTTKIYGAEKLKWHSSSRASQDNRSRANLIEALLLFICLIMVVAITLSLFAAAYISGAKSARYEEAVTLAANTAERFSADPLGIPLEQVTDGLMVRCDTSLSADEAGQMYSAYIRVFDADLQTDHTSAITDLDPLYSLRTARYLSTSGNANDQYTRENSIINRLVVLTIQDDVSIYDAELVAEGGE